MSWWITWSDGSEGCVELTADERPTKGEGENWGQYNARHQSAVVAKAEAAKNGLEVKMIRSLPYPATPRIGTHTDMPPLCFSPHSCAGFSACPRRISCTE